MININTSLLTKCNIHALLKRNNQADLSTYMLKQDASYIVRIAWAAQNKSRKKKNMCHDPHFKKWGLRPKGEKIRRYQALLSVSLCLAPSRPCFFPHHLFVDLLSFCLNVS